MDRFAAVVVLLFGIMIGIVIGGGIGLFFAPSVRTEAFTCEEKADAASLISDTLFGTRFDSDELSTTLKDIAAMPPTEGMLAFATGSANRLCRPNDGAVIARDLKKGELLLIVGHDESGDYKRLDDGTWVASFLVREVKAVAPLMDEMSPLDVDMSRIRLTFSGEDDEMPETALSADQAISPMPTEDATETAVAPSPTPPAEVSAGTALYAQDLLAASDVIQSTGLETALLRGGLQTVAIEWLTTIRQQLIAVEEQYERLQQLPPPTELDGVYRQFVDAAQVCEQSAQQLRDGLNTSDLLTLQQGLRTYHRCRLGLAETSQTIRTYANEWAISDLPPMPTLTPTP